MNRKIALALVGLVIMTLASFAPIHAPAPPPVQWDGYVTMGGQKIVTVQVYAGPMPVLFLKAPFLTRDPWLSPYSMWENITFSDEIDLDGPGPLPPCVVFLTVPMATPLVHVIYSDAIGALVGHYWLRIVEAMAAPGWGYIYTVDGISDVDTITFNNNTGTYWEETTPYMPGQLASPNIRTGPFLDPGPDMLPGFLPTKDDGFGDGTPDPKGSSILYMPETFLVYGYNETTHVWDLMFGAPLMKTMTTGTAYDHVREPTSALYCMSSKKAGKPWEYLASCAPWKNASCNKKVTYASAGSICHYMLPPPYSMDVLYDLEEKKVRQDQIGPCNKVIPDITCDQMVDIGDIVRCALSFGKHDEGLGPDGLPNTADDWKVASPGYDAGADMNGDGLIDISDLVLIAVNFGYKITAQCVKPP